VRISSDRLGLALGLLLLSVACGGTTQGGAPAPDAGVDRGGDAGSIDAGHDSSKHVHEAGGRDQATADSPSDSPTTTKDAGPCGMRAGMRGLTMRSVMVGGVKRTYLAYLPMKLAATTAVPFVYAFHGFTQSGQDMYDITGYSTLADSEGFAVVFPDGEGGAGSILPPWNIENAGQKVCGAGQFEVAKGDDFGFMDAMRADVENDQCVDSAHVFSVGFSMGGYFTHHVGCYRDDIRAVAPHSGGTLGDLSVCTTGHVPAIIFHGTVDPVISENCDDPAATPLPSFPASGTLWAAKNGCKNTYSTVPETGTGGANGQCYVYDGCPADGQVEVCTFTGLPHCWAGGTDPGSGGTYSCTAYSSATQLQWDFFKKYAW
jgi:polyhydroxybutyrate depolymerase